MLDQEPSPHGLAASLSDALGGPSLVAGAAAAGPRRSRDPGRGPSRPTDLGRVRAVIDGLPEAVIVTESGGDLRLTNPAADRLFAKRPIVDQSDLLSRFEAIQPGP